MTHINHQNGRAEVTGMAIGIGPTCDWWNDGEGLRCITFKMRKPEA